MYGEYPGWNELKNSIEILAKLQKKFFQVIDNKDSDIDANFKTLFLFLNKIKLKSSFMIYDGFLLLLSRSLIVRSSSQSNIAKIKRIINELIIEYNLKEMFHSTTIFGFFKGNQEIIKYLFEEHNFTDKLFETNTKQNKYYVNKLDAELMKFILQDDLDSFISYISCIENFDLDYQLRTSYINLINTDNSYPLRVSIMDCSLIYGSIKIFKYLWLNKVDYNQKSLEYSIIGGNHEIINTLESESKYKYDNECVYKSIQYNHLELLQYLMESQNMNLTFELLFQHAIKNYNFELIDQIFKNHPNTRNQIFVDLFIKSIQLFFSLDLFIFCNFIQLQPNIDINTKYKVTLVFYDVPISFIK